MERDELCFVWVNSEAIAQEPVSDDKKTICAFLPDQLVVGPGSHNCPIIDLCRKGAEAPGFSEAEEWENIECGQDGGQRGSLGYAMVQNNFGEGFAVER